MTPDEFCTLVFEVKTNLETKFTEALAPATEIVGRIITARTDGDTVRDYFALNSDWFTFTVTPRQKGQLRE